LCFLFNSKSRNENFKCIKQNSDYFRVRVIDNYNINSDVCNNRTRIAFGSCNNQFNSQKFWNKIHAFDPNIWIWLGDNIYADYFGKDKDKDTIKKIKHSCSCYLLHMKKQYDSLVRNNFYQKLLKSNTYIT